MATQDGGGISLSIKKEENRQQIRLLELPPELLTLLTSDRPPILKFKSKVGDPGNELANSAALCTPTTTYNIRQVNHSNSQYITQPVPTIGENLSTPAIEAIASSGFVLEISPDKPASAVPYLKETVPLWVPGGRVDYGSNMPQMSKQDHFKNIPLDDASCEQAWLHLGCCEINGVARRPGTIQQLQGWQYMLSTLTAEGIDPLVPITTKTLDILREGLRDVDTPRPILDANIVSMTEDNTLHHDKCLRFVGVRLLEKMDRSPLKEFMQEWKDLLPEKWRDDATTDFLYGHYILRNNNQDIAYKYNATEDIPPTTAAPVEEKVTAGTKRKWHDKFRPSKKTA